MKTPPPFSKVITFGLYEGALSDAINHFKFQGIRRLSKPLGELLAQCDLPVTDGIIPVPLTKRSLRARGFNQALLLSRIVARKHRIPLLWDHLVKIRETPPQIGLSAQERLRNVKKAFEVQGDMHGRHLLLVDDVMTTGATVMECARVLLQAGAKEVTVLTLARAGGT